MENNKLQVQEQVKSELAIQTQNSLQLWRESVEQVKSLIPSKKVSGLTVSTAMQSPQVSMVTKDLGQEYVSALFTKAVNEICLMTNTAIAADAIILIADSLVADFWYMKIDEILMVLNRGLKGYYGPSNKNISAQVIFEWFNKHEQERNNHFYNQHMERKNSFGNPNDRSPEPRLAKDVFEQMVDQRVNHRIEKYKEAAKEKKTWTDRDTENAANNF